MFESLTQPWLDNMRAFSSRENNSGCLKSPLKRRADNKIRLEVFEFVSGFLAL